MSLSRRKVPLKKTQAETKAERRWDLPYTVHQNIQVRHGAINAPKRLERNSLSTISGKKQLNWSYRERQRRMRGLWIMPLSQLDRWRTRALTSLILESGCGYKSSTSLVGMKDNLLILLAEGRFIHSKSFNISMGQFNNCLSATGWLYFSSLWTTGSLTA